MSVLPEWVWIGAGVCSLLVGLVTLLVAPLSGTLWNLYLLAAVPLAILAAVWHLFVGRAAETEETEARPWSTEGALVESRPEASTARYPVSGQALSEVIDAAARSARRERSVEAGISRIRPQLRAMLEAALVQAGADPGAVEDALAAGNWTDDPVAAAVLEARIDLPPQSLRQRIGAWLFPDRVVRQRLRRAVQAVAEAVEAELPNVVGQRTRRTVPTHPPSLAELRRGADGSLHPAIDPAAIGSRQRVSTAEDGSADDTATETEQPEGSTARTTGLGDSGGGGSADVETDPEAVLRR